MDQVKRFIFHPADIMRLVEKQINEETGGGYDTYSVIWDIRHGTLSHLEVISQKRGKVPASGGHLQPVPKTRGRQRKRVTKEDWEKLLKGKSQRFILDHMTRDQKDFLEELVLLLEELKKGPNDPYSLTVADLHYSDNNRGKAVTHGVLVNMGILLPPTDRTIVGFSYIKLSPQWYSIHPWWAQLCGRPYVPIRVAGLTEEERNQIDAIEARTARVDWGRS